MQPEAFGKLLEIAGARLAEVSDTPYLDAEVLLSHATGHHRTYFRAWPERPPTPEQQARFDALLEQRLAGRPIAYLLGWREFWSREFSVNDAVLIPRPETELLVECALQQVPMDEPTRILDLGTGSGAIAITLALERPCAVVTATDCSTEALAVARHNAERLKAPALRFVEGDWFAAVAGDDRFELCVSNPPYIAAGDPHLSAGDLRFEPPLALASGVDGLDAIRCIIAAAPEHLADGGGLLLEHGFDQAESVRLLLVAAGFVDIESHRDLQGHERVTGGRWLPGAAGMR